MRALAMLANSTRVKRKELLSSYNFAAFYLPHVLQARRVLYMDTDVIVRGDVHELAQMTVPKPNLQPDFNVSVFECFDTSSSAGLRELDESDRSVQKSAESTSI